MEAKVQVGDEVWVKPPNARCTTRWNRGIVNGVNSPNNVEVDGTPRHLLDLRPTACGVSEEDRNVDAGGVEDETTEEQRYSRRTRRVPLWHSDYVTE